jgi:hypothetical protein
MFVSIGGIPRWGRGEMTWTDCLLSSLLSLVMLGSDEEKQSDHGENLRTAALLWQSDDNAIQGHPCVGGPWISVDTEGVLLRL